MSYKQLLFTFEGRINRKTYWLWNVFYYVMITFLAIGLSSVIPSLSHMLLPVVMLILLIPDFAVTAKRWHDRDKATNRLWLSVPVVLSRMLSPMAASVDSPSPFMLVLTLIALACGIWILIECGFRKGVAGANQYGADPLLN